MLRRTLAVISVLVLSGCAASLKVEKLQDFTPQSKTFVLLNSTKWDARLRSELSKKGFKILRFASQEKVVTEGKDGELARVFNEAEARYGLTFTWTPVKPCLFNSEQVIDGTLEVTDIKTNEVLLVIEKGGLTGFCASPQDNVFEVLADALEKAWHK